MLQIGLAGRIIDGGSALGHHGCHHDVGGASHRCLVEKHVTAIQLLGIDLIYIALCHMMELRSQSLETQEVGVQSATSDLVAAGFGDGGLAHASQQRTDHHDRATQLRTLLHKLVALQIVQIQVIGLEGASKTRNTCLCCILGCLCRDLHAYILEQLDEVHHVSDLRNVVNGHLLACQQRGANHLQGLVLGTLRIDSSAKRVSSLNDKCCHIVKGFCYLRFLPLRLG